VRVSEAGGELAGGVEDAGRLEGGGGLDDGGGEGGLEEGAGEGDAGGAEEGGSVEVPLLDMATTRLQWQRAETTTNTKKTRQVRCKECRSGRRCRNGRCLAAATFQRVRVLVSRNAAGARLGWGCGAWKEGSGAESEDLGSSSSARRSVEW